MVAASREGGGRPQQPVNHRAGPCRPAAAGHTRSVRFPPVGRVAARAIVALLTILIAAAAEAEDPTVLVVAHEDVAVPPWILEQPGQGLDCELARRAALAAGLELRFEVVPWKRCLALLEAGRVDAVLSASYLPERAVYARYPRTGEGGLDHDRRLHLDAYALYRPLGSRLDYDGSRLHHLDGRIAARSGFSVIDRLRSLGAEVDDDSKELEPIFRRLTSARVVGAALLVSSAERYLQDHPDIARQVERVPTPLLSKSYFLIAGRPRYDANPAPFEALWTAIGEIRESPDFLEHLRGVNDQER